MHWTADRGLVTVYPDEQKPLLTKERQYMNTLIRSSIYLPMAMFLTLAVAGPAVAQKLVPFSGSVQGQEIDIFNPPPPGTLTVTGNLSGVATQLGRLTLNYNLTVDLTNGTAAG